MSIPSGSVDGDQVSLDGEEGAYAVVRVAPQPPDSALVRGTAAAGLVVALALLALLLFGHGV